MGIDALLPQQPLQLLRIRAALRHAKTRRVAGADRDDGDRRGAGGRAGQQREQSCEREREPEHATPPGANVLKNASPARQSIASIHASLTATTGGNAWRRTASR